MGESGVIDEPKSKQGVIDLKQEIMGGKLPLWLNRRKRRQRADPVREVSVEVSQLLYNLRHQFDLSQYQQLLLQLSNSAWRLAKTSIQQETSLSYPVVDYRAPSAATNVSLPITSPLEFGHVTNGQSSVSELILQPDNIAITWLSSW